MLLKENDIKALIRLIFFLIKKDKNNLFSLINFFSYECFRSLIISESEKNSSEIKKHFVDCFHVTRSKICLS